MRHSTELPTPESLMYEIYDESKCLKQRIHLQAQAHIYSHLLHISSLPIDTCSNYGLPCHKVECCWYKYAHLRREG